MGEDKDKDEAKPEDHHMEDDAKTNNEDEMWVRRRIRTKLVLKISIWKIMGKVMRMKIRISILRMMRRTMKI